MNVRYTHEWAAVCERGHYPPGGILSKNPKFGWAKRHARECGSTVLVRHIQEWSVKLVLEKEQNDN